MNASVNNELAEFIFEITKTLIANGSVQGITKTIMKVDVLRYYRETKQTFINLGSLLISQTDGRLYFFDTRGELVGIDRIQI